MTGFLWPKNVPDMGDPSAYGLVSHVRHKTNPDVYGAVCNTSNGMMFQKWKWNKGAKEATITAKPVDDSMWDSFDRISLAEFCEIETVDMSKNA